MARPESKGLKYFPFDVGFFADRKIRLLRAEHGPEGVEVYQRLVCKAYGDNGYYLQWDDDADCVLMADETGLSTGKIRLIVSSCLKRSLFDGKLFKAGKVLSSRGIQRRYFFAVSETKTAAARHGRYTYIEQGLCLLTDEDFSEINKTHAWLKVAQNPNYQQKTEDKSPINPPNEIKLNNIKENQTKPNPGLDPGGGVLAHYVKNIEGAPSGLTVQKLGEWLDELPEELLIRAVDESAMNNKRSFKYIDGILRRFKERGITSLEMVERLDKEWRSSKAVTVKTAPAAPLKKNKYTDYKMRDFDFAELSRMAMEAQMEE